MGWEDLLSSEDHRVLPWIGGRKIHDKERTWTITGALPVEFGWYKFDVSSNRKAKLLEDAELDVEYEDGRETIKGYAIGNRIIPDNARVDPDPKKLVNQTDQLFLVEPGLDRFARVIAAKNRDGKLVYIRQEFPEGPEIEVQTAYQDRLDSIVHVKNVSPALDLAFRWLSYQRIREEERERERERIRIEEEKRRAAEERRQEAMKNLGTGVGRRELAKVDFKAAAKAALSISGAELLDARPSRRKNEMVVQYRFRGHRLECVVNKNTLRIVDAGVCLDDHKGERGDSYFTLESIVPVIKQAIDEHKLVIWRHA